MSTRTDIHTGLAGLAAACGSRPFAVALAPVMATTCGHVLEQGNATSLAERWKA